MDGSTASVRSQAAGKPSLRCACGRVVHGNAGIAAHRKACEANLESDGWPIDAGMEQAIRDSAPAGTVSYVSRALGRFYLERRRQGDKTELPWREYRDLLWRFVDEASTAAVPT